MREIKFRAWDKEQSRMINGIDLTTQDGALHPINGSWDNTIFIDSPNVEIMQFTGLKDKNGKEIYEGDIFDCWSQGYHRIGVITWGVTRFFIKIPPPQAIWNLSGGQETGEVIGNIYENPELLEA